MKNKGIWKRICCGVMALVLLMGSTLSLPLKAYAYVEDGYNLDLNRVQVDAKDRWRQIKNAAVIHLVTQKLYKCIPSMWRVQSTANVQKGSVWASEWMNISLPDSLKGFFGIEGDTLNQVDINVGPWLDKSLTGDTNGQMTCNAGSSEGNNVLDVFAYIYKTYTASSSLSDATITNSRISESDIQEIVCGEEGSGLFSCTEMTLGQKVTLLRTVCPTLSVTNFMMTLPTCIGRAAAALIFSTLSLGYSDASRIAYIKGLYNEIIERSGNDLLPRWNNDNDLETYNNVDGFYLYSLDYSALCLRSGFGGNRSNTGDVPYITDNGEVMWQQSSSSSSSLKAYSFVGSGQLSCSDLVTKMQDYIKKYITYVNAAVYQECKRVIDEGIETVKAELASQESSGNLSGEQQEDAQKLRDEYGRIQRVGEYVIKVEGGTETLIQAAGFTADDYIWQCRKSLPYIDVNIIAEPDLPGAIESGDAGVDITSDTLDKACREVIEHLEWIICPILVWFAQTADGLTETVEEMLDLQTGELWK